MHPSEDIRLGISEDTNKQTRSNIAALKSHPDLPGDIELKECLPPILL